MGLKASVYRGLRGKKWLLIGSVFFFLMAITLPMYYDPYQFGYHFFYFIFCYVSGGLGALWLYFYYIHHEVDIIPDKVVPESISYVVVEFKQTEDGLEWFGKLEDGKTFIAVFVDGVFRMFVDGDCPGVRDELFYIGCYKKFITVNAEDVYYLWLHLQTT